MLKSRNRLDFREKTAHPESEKLFLLRDFAVGNAFCFHTLKNQPGRRICGCGQIRERLENFLYKSGKAVNDLPVAALWRGKMWNEFIHRVLVTLWKTNRRILPKSPVCAVLRRFFDCEKAVI